MSLRWLQISLVFITYYVVHITYQLSPTSTTTMHVVTSSPTPSPNNVLNGTSNPSEPTPSPNNVLTSSPSKHTSSPTEPTLPGLSPTSTTTIHVVTSSPTPSPNNVLNITSNPSEPTPSPNNVLTPSPSKHTSSPTEPTPPRLSPTATTTNHVVTSSPTEPTPSPTEPTPSPNNVMTSSPSKPTSSPSEPTPSPNNVVTSFPTEPTSSPNNVVTSAPTAPKKNVVTLTPTERTPSPIDNDVSSSPKSTESVHALSSVPTEWTQTPTTVPTGPTEAPVSVCETDSYPNYGDCDDCWSVIDHDIVEKRGYKLEIKLSLDLCNIHPIFSSYWIMFVFRKAIWQIGDELSDTSFVCSIDDVCVPTDGLTIEPIVENMDVIRTNLDEYVDACANLVDYCGVNGDKPQYRVTLTIALYCGDEDEMRSLQKVMDGISNEEFEGKSEAISQVEDTSCSLGFGHVFVNGGISNTLKDEQGNILQAEVDITGSNNAVNVSYYVGVLLMLSVLSICI